MPTPPILEVSTTGWTYEDVAVELEQLAMLEDLGAEAGPPSDLARALFDGELAEVAGELEELAKLEGR